MIILRIKNIAYYSERTTVLKTLENHYKNKLCKNRYIEKWTIYILKVIYQYFKAVTQNFIDCIVREESNRPIIIFHLRPLNTYKTKYMVMKHIFSRYIGLYIAL